MAYPILEEVDVLGPHSMKVLVIGDIEEGEHEVFHDFPVNAVHVENHFMEHKPNPTAEDMADSARVVGILALDVLTALHHAGLIDCDSEYSMGYPTAYLVRGSEVWRVNSSNFDEMGGPLAAAKAVVLEVYWQVDGGAQEPEEWERVLSACKTFEWERFVEALEPGTDEYARVVGLAEGLCES